MDGTNPLSPVTYGVVKRRIENFEPKDEFSRFLPQKAISELATEERVATTLSSLNLFNPDNVNEVARFVAKSAPRLFLSLIFATYPSLIKDIFENNLTDGDLLPTPSAESQDSASDVQRLCDNDRLDIPFNSTRPSTIFRQLGEKPYDDFVADQGAFIAPEFPRQFSTYVFHPSRHLPYSRPENEVRHGGSFFSVVWKAILDESHLSREYSFLYPYKVQNGFEVAVKSLTTAESDSGVRVDEFYRREVETLEKMAEMAERGEKHLIRAIAAYGSGKKRQFIFPWAKGGNLDEFWDKFDAKESDGRDNRIAWSLEQMVGVARALTKLHERGVRHGDIKPQNILHFTANKPGSASGTLVISDVGLAKYHEAYTVDRTKYTTTTSVTVDYQPPEPEKLTRPRVYDNWSLGCVFLEFTIWLVKGYDNLSKFRAELKDKHKFKRFWEYGAEDVPKVHHVVLEKMKELEKEGPLAHLTRPMVALIRTKLLITTGNTYDSNEEQNILQDLIEIQRISRHGAKPPPATDRNQQVGSSSSKDQARTGISNKVRRARRSSKKHKRNH